MTLAWAGFHDAATHEYELNLAPELALLTDSGRTQTATISGGGPTLEAFVARFKELAVLAPGWNGEDAIPPTPGAMLRSLEVLVDVLPNGEVLPTVVPTPEGGVQLVWRTNGFKIVLDTDSDSSQYAWGEELRNGPTWAGELDSVREELVLSLKKLSVAIEPFPAIQ